MGERPARGDPTAAGGIFVDDEAPTKRLPSTPDVRALLQASRRTDEEAVVDEEPRGLPRRLGRAQWMAVLCIAGAGLVAVMCLLLVWRREPPAAHRAAPAQALAVTAQPRPVPGSTPSLAPAATEPSAQPAAGTTPASEPSVSRVGTILTAGRAKGHRIFVDGRVVGEAPTPIPIRCGPHRVKVGSRAREQAIFVPCGDTVTVN